MSHFCKEINGQPTENDILLGRGGHNNKHSGNEKLRLMAMERVQKYMSCNKIEKSHMTMELALLVKKLDPPGRFLQKNPDDGNKWYEMDLKTARLKTSQVYRDTVAKVRGAADCTSDLREKSSKSHDFDEDAVKHLHTSTDHFHGFEDAVEPFSKYDDFGFDSDFDIDFDSLSFSSLQRITDPHSCQDLDGYGLTSEILTDKIDVFDSVYDVSENLADLLNDTKVPPSFEPEPISESKEMHLPRNFENKARRFQDNVSMSGRQTSSKSNLLRPPSSFHTGQNGSSNQLHAVTDSAHLQQLQRQSRQFSQSHAAFQSSHVNQLNENHQTNHPSFSSSLGYNQLLLLLDQLQQSQQGFSRHSFDNTVSSEAFSSMDHNKSTPYFQPQSYQQSTNNVQSNTTTPSFANYVHGNNQQTGHIQGQSSGLNQASFSGSQNNYQMSILLDQLKKPQLWVYRSPPSTTAPSTHTDSISEAPQMNSSVSSKQSLGNKRVNDAMQNDALQTEACNISKLSIDEQSSSRPRAFAFYQSYRKFLAGQGSKKKKKKSRLR